MTLASWKSLSGMIVTIAGVASYAFLERHGRESTEDLQFIVLSKTFLPTLIIGTLVWIVCAAIERQHLPVIEGKIAGTLYLLVGCIFSGTFVKTGNVHGWTFAFIFPAVAGTFAGAVLLWKTPAGGTLDRNHRKMNE